MQFISRVPRNLARTIPHVRGMASSPYAPLFAQADCICFDVDSTLCTDEGIDELAAALGKGEAVAELTNRAMGGTMPFEEAISQRLDLLNPSVDALANFNSQHPPSFTSKIPELVETLKSRQQDVILNTGGILPIVRHAAKGLDIPLTDVFGIDLVHNEDGSFKDFDRKAFTVQPMGKALAIKHLRETRGYQSIVMIGDGATDVEAGTDAELMIGFGGNVVRPVVEENCDWWVTEIDELLQALKDTPRR